ncbi:MAG: metallophosphoesterase [Oscillospiraceae bacterium]|nr:metallophosphoesterase [Oscillospiraceae bacterium]
MLKLWHFTDTHLRLGDDPEMPVRLLDAALEAFVQAKDCPILLISGDLTGGGLVAEHRAMRERLRRVRAAGKRVYVITATHDYGLGDIRSMPEGLPPFEARTEGGTYRSELRGIYDEFGFADAISEYERNSYTAQLSGRVRLLALNDDGDGHDFCGFSEGQMEWALEQISKAKQAGQLIFGMTHHPSQPPSPIYPVISKRDMLGNYEENTRRLANAGLRVLFTGHSHIHNIAPTVTPEGNPYWDVNTGAIAPFPNKFRALALEEETGLLRVTTHRVPDVSFNGVSQREAAAAHFDARLRNIFEHLDTDYEAFARHDAGAMSMRYEKAMSLRLPLHWGGRVINRMSLGGLGVLLCCRHKIPKAVRSDSFKELVLTLIRNIYSGEEKYNAETDISKALLAIAGRLNVPPVKKAMRSLGFAGLPAFLGALIYDDSPDDTVEIML